MIEVQNSSLQFTALSFSSIIKSIYLRKKKDFELRFGPN